MKKIIEEKKKLEKMRQTYSDFSDEMDARDNEKILPELCELVESCE